MHPLLALGECIIRICTLPTLRKKLRFLPTKGTLGKTVKLRKKEQMSQEEIN